LSNTGIEGLLDRNWLCDVYVCKHDVYRMVRCFAVMVRQIHFCDQVIFLNWLQLKKVHCRTVFSHDTAADQACVFFVVVIDCVSRFFLGRFCCLFVTGSVLCFFCYVGIHFYVWHFNPELMLHICLTHICIFLKILFSYCRFKCLLHYPSNSSFIRNYL